MYLANPVLFSAFVYIVFRGSEADRTQTLNPVGTSSKTKVRAPENHVSETRKQPLGDRNLKAKEREKGLIVRLWAEIRL